MSKKLIEQVDLNKIQHVWDDYIQARIEDRDMELCEKLNDIERVILKALAEDFRDNI